jgi:hypothetical protein
MAKIISKHDLDLIHAEALAGRSYGSQEEYEAIRDMFLARAGKFYPFIVVANFNAWLAFVVFAEDGRTSQAYRLSKEEQEESGVTDEILLRAVEEAGGAISIIGYYPISDEIQKILAHKGPASHPDGSRKK